MDDVLKPRPASSGLFLIAAIVFSCVALMTFGGDRLCATALAWRVPEYPGATIISERYNLLSAKGLGQTVTSYYVPQPENEVSRWMNVEVGRRSYEATSRNDLQTYYSITNISWDVRPAEDGVGAQLIVRASCLSR